MEVVIIFKAEQKKFHNSILNKATIFQLLVILAKNLILVKLSNNQNIIH